jgi:hypothetical protein
LGQAKRGYPEQAQEKDETSHGLTPWTQEAGESLVMSAVAIHKNLPVRATTIHGFAGRSKGPL